MRGSKEHRSNCIVSIRNLAGYNITEIYDTKTNKWSSVPDMPIPRRGLEAVAVDDKIYLFGGKIGATDELTNKVDIFHIVR